MIVIANKTETKLLRNLRRGVRETPTQKCFYLKFSQAETPQKELFETFLRLLDELPNSYMANVYICHDKDIFIMMQGFMQRHFHEFVKKLSEAMESPQILDLVEIFELATHWSKLEAICTYKIEAIDKERQKEEEAKIREQAEQATLEILSQLDMGLIKNLPARREKRREPHIIVVDDDQVSRTLVRNVLGGEFHVECAKDGHEALKLYLQTAPDMCFLDIGLPDISGHDLLEIFSQIDPEHYIIMFSGRKDKENMMRALHLGAQGFVGKPFSRDKLLHYIGKSPFIEKKRGKSGKPEAASR